MVDIIIIVVIILFIYLGYKKGLVKTVFSLLSLFISIFIATKIYPILVKVMTESTDIENKISMVVYNNLSKVGVTTLEDIPQFQNMPSAFKNTISTEVMGTVGEDLILKLSDYISGLVLGLICMVVVFVVTSIIVSIIGNIIDGIARLPGLKGVNKVGGAVVGLVKGIIIIYVVLFVVGMLPIKSTKKLSIEVNNSMIGGYIYNHNIITEQVSKIYEGV